MSLDFNLIDLRLFMYIAKHNSITKGAASCHMSTPAASVRMRNFENSLGTKLLERTRNGVLLTQAGQALLPHAHLILDQVSALNAHLKGYAEGTKGQIRIVANNLTISETLPMVLRHYMKLHPDISVDVRPKLNSEVIQAVRDNLADFGLFGGEFDSEGLETLVYLKDRFVVIASCEHPLAELDSVHLARALDYDIICLPEYSSVHAFVRHVIDEKRLFPRMSVFVENYDALFCMIEANVGIGLIPECAARRYARSGAIKIIPVSDARAARDLSVCFRSFEDLPAFAKDFLDVLVEVTGGAPIAWDQGSDPSAGARASAGR